MPTLFAPADRDAILARMDRLEPGTPRQWGTMSPAQAMAHCAAAMEGVAGLKASRQKVLCKLLAWMVRGTVLGDKPFGKGSPTDPTFVVKDDRDLDAERARVNDLVARLVARGPAQADGIEHVFFGRLSGEEWGVLMAKHLDHHLRQFGV
jgi:hypothetical protein